MTPRVPLIAFVLLTGGVAAAPTAWAQERLCDPSHENCRTPLLELIRNESQGIDVGFWFMEDARYAHALIDAHDRGVPIRVLFDTKANSSYPYNVTITNMLRDAGIPMRRQASSWFHWKVMLFAGQNVVQFGSANYSPHAFVYVEPFVDYIDESIFFSDDPAIVNSFKTRFDDAWVNTSRFASYANISGTLTRSYPIYPTSGALNFPPFQSFPTRAAARYNAEDAGIDVIMYRLGDRRHADAIIAARQRGVPVRAYIEQRQYRDSRRPLSAYDTDRLYAAGVQLRQRNHFGWNHEKLVLLHEQRMAIFGSQNWTDTPGQYEHNYFTTKGWLYEAFRDQFERKWNSSSETEPFVPQPPNTPQNRSPADGAVIDTASVTLRWYAGLWAHKYDIYFGTSSNPPRIAANIELGYSRSSSDLKSYTVSGLSAGTTYYWRIVSKTMANVSRNGPVWAVQTEGSVSTSSLPSGWQARDIGTVGIAGSAGASSGTFTVRGAGADVWGTSDAFHYAYRTLAGDGTITARVASISGTEAWTKVGVMIRASTSFSSAHAFMLVSRGKGIAFQRRRTAGGLTTHTSGGSGTAPRWVRLRRSGNVVTGYVSTNGTSWTTVASDTISLPSTALVGLAVSSHTRSSLATGVFDNVSTSSGSTSTSLPAGWQARDIGAVGASGSASASGGTFTVRGSGADVWGTADAFHLVYRLLAGDGTITARVASLAGVESWTKAGVMIRGSTASNAAHAFMLVSRGKGLAFQRRTTAGAITTHTSGGSGTAPQWVRLTRSGTRISAYRSNDGGTWTLVGSDSFSLPGTVLVGLAVTSHDAGTLATGTFDNVATSGGD
jgi:regulation of enolase protein 1 (concanavalin A-like superfamily)